MVDFYNDQADGLRRMLATPKPRCVTILSTLEDTARHLMLGNLAVGLKAMGSQVLLLDARRYPRVGASLGARRVPCLLETATDGEPATMAVQKIDAGFSFASISHGRCHDLRREDRDGAISALFGALARRFDIVLTDAEIDERDELPLFSLDQTQLVIQVSGQTESIKSGYTLIKRLSAVSGRTRFGVLVTQTEEHRARMIYANLAQTAKRYLATPLTYMGFVPPDDHLSRAARAGRSVIDAFPSAVASVAFRQIAGQFSLL